MLMVDELIVWSHAKPPFHRGSSHLTTTGDIDELHRFAVNVLGMRRSWFQPSAKMPHYDLTPERRGVALRRGAAFVSWREQVHFRRGTMKSIQLASPDDIRARLARGWDVGFTGAQDGMTEAQQIAIVRLLYGLRGGVYPGVTTGQQFHHGDNEASDCEVGRFAAVLGYTVIIHPPTDGSKRGFGPCHFAIEPRPYLERNQHIVNCAMVMLATPNGPERLRSGTWSTVRAARRSGVPRVIVYPAGDIFLELT